MVDAMEKIKTISGRERAETNDLAHSAGPSSGSYLSAAGLQTLVVRSTDHIAVKAAGSFLGPALFAEIKA
jgi:hypothetical protein